jgi:hypothetical protein
MTDNAMLQAIQDTLSHWGSLDNWWVRVADGSQARAFSAVNSTSGVFFNSGLVAHDFEGTAFSGFFPAISPENRNDVIAALFANERDQGQWLINYLDNNEGLLARFTSRNPQQQAFIDAYNRLTVGFLDDSDGREGDFRLDAFTSGITRDQTLTDREFWQLLNAHGFRDDLQRMGEPLARQWLMFAGGAIQGVMDYERRIDAISFQRFTPDEFEGLWSVDARQQIANAVRSIGLRGSDDALFERAMMDMEERCGNSRDHTFTPPTTPDASVRCFDGHCR